MEVLDAIEVVLREEGRALHYQDLTDRILERRLWETEGKTPQDTVKARLAVDLQKYGAESRFIRTAPGTFALRAPRRRDRSVSEQLSPARSSASNPKNEAVKTRKLGVQEIRSLACKIVKTHPEGIRYGQLITAVLDRHPETPRNTVQGSIWNLDTQFPTEIQKPARGVFMSVTVTERTPDPRPEARMTEEAFYEPFADWLKNDVGDAIDAMPLGGSGLRSKWGTPDVIGVYRPLPSDRIKFPHEIISAEIKIEPQAPVVAFGQAVAYRLFSAKTYIVMPETMTQEDLDRLEALCMLFGVGLVLFKLNPQQPVFSIRVRAQRFSPDMYFVNKFADGLHQHDLGKFNRLFQ